MKKFLMNKYICLIPILCSCSDFVSFFYEENPNLERKGDMQNPFSDEQDQILNISDQVLITTDQVLITTDQVLITTDQILPTFDQTLTVKDQTLSIYDQILPIPDQMLMIYDQMLILSDQMLPIPDQMIPIPDQMIPIPDQMIPIPDQMLPIPDQMLPIPDQMLPDQMIDSVCGNQIVEVNEQCDDGNLSNTDSCTTSCMYPCEGNCPTIDLVTIHAGIFNMGSNDSASEQPIHQVSVLNNFQISRTEITVSQYRNCVNAGICNTNRLNLNTLCNWTTLPDTKENYPINCVDFFQARKFAIWVGGDLPSEVQWEYSARSEGLNVKYPWMTLDENCSFANYKNCFLKSVEVCSIPNDRTAQGLCDMGGNVLEWVLDEWHNQYQMAPINEMPWCSDANCEIINQYRVNRGGYWTMPIFNSRVTSRVYSLDNTRSNFTGFRIVRKIPTVH